MHKNLKKKLAKTLGVTSDAILKDIKQGKYAPIYFLQGAESFFIDQISDYIEKFALSENDKGFNQTILYGKDTTIGQIITSAKRFPMMAQRQVVLIKEAQEVPDIEKYVKNKVAGKEIEFNALEEYAKKPLESTILVFCFKYKTLDGRKGLAKVMEQNAILFTSKGLYDNELPAWVAAYVKSIGFEINEQAVRLICEFVGNNLTRISNEINKICVNITAKTVITDAHVVQYVGVSKEYNVFELQKAIGTRNILLSNKIINYFAENPKDNPIQMTIGNLFSYFSKILLVKSNKPANDFEAAKILGVAPFIAKDYLLVVQKFNPSQILNTFTYLREADMKSKGFGVGTNDDTQVMKELVFKILHG